MKTTEQLFFNFNQRFQQQMTFIAEVDRVKNIFRQSYLADGSRRENDAEHSWHLAMMAMILAEYANVSIDVLRVLKMVLIHDLVEIDAGDTYIYDEVGQANKLEKEIQAADRIFGLLPEDQCLEYRALWEEFEARETAEAKFAAALDRSQPVLLNYLSGGIAWKHHGIAKHQVFARNGHSQEGSEQIWECIQAIVEAAVEESFLLDR